MKARTKFYISNIYKRKIHLKHSVYLIVLSGSMSSFSATYTFPGFDSGMGKSKNVYHPTLCVKGQGL